MPRERTEIFRESNSKPKEKIIVLAYEGSVTEAQYFEKLKENTRFKDDLIHLKSLKRRKKDGESAPVYVFRKLKTEAKDEFNLDKTDELWMIIDRDQWNDIPKISALCKNEGNFYLALSNPCFEFWLLLHVKDIIEFNEQELNDIFENKKVSNTKTYVKRLLGELLEEGYNESRPKPQRFFPYIDIAITRAKNLDNQNEDYPTKLGSHVYKLVQKIIT